MGVSVAYVGSHAVNLLYGRNINQPDPSTTPFSISALPNPNFDTINLYENGASQRYNSLQVSAAKRMGKSLQFSSRLDLGPGSDGPVGQRLGFADNPIQNQFDRKAEWGNNAYTPTHRFYADAIYSLPVGAESDVPEPDAASGRRNPGRMAAFDGRHSANRPVVHAELRRLRPIQHQHHRRTARQDRRSSSVSGESEHQQLVQCRRRSEIPGCPANNPICDNPANVGRFGNSGVNILSTPAMKNLDLALMKEFMVTEHKTLRFQATFSDVLNHPNFGYPDGDISSPDTAAVITSTNSNYLSGSSTFESHQLRLAIPVLMFRARTALGRAPVFDFGGLSLFRSRVPFNLDHSDIGRYAACGPSRLLWIPKDPHS